MLIPASGAQLLGPASGGKTTVINNLGTSAQILVAANQYRASISFANPGSVVVYVAPVVNAQGVPFTPTLSALGGTIPLQPGTFVTLGGEVGFAWQGFAAGGSNNPFTVMESNI